MDFLMKNASPVLRLRPPLRVVLRSGLSTAIHSSAKKEAALSDLLSNLRSNRSTDFLGVPSLKTDGKYTFHPSGSRKPTSSLGQVNTPKGWLLLSPTAKTEKISPSPKATGSGSLRVLPPPGVVILRSYVPTRSVR